jgi:hypothetical protein
MGAPALLMMAAGTLMSADAQMTAGNIAAEEAELGAKIQETAATQREADRKTALADAMATANAQAAAGGVAAFEGSPLTILNESIRAEETATERDVFNTRISALTERARGKNAQFQGKAGAFSTLLKGGGQAAALA